MRKAGLVILSGLLLLGLSGCGAGDDSEEEIKKEAALIKVCKDNGGEPFYNILDSLQCDMTSATK